MAASNTVVVGPWGGSGGDPWEFIPDGKIVGFKIRTGDVVEAISFIFKDGSGNIYESANFGGDKGALHHVPFAHDEEINKISGSYGVIYDLTVVTSLTFHTNKTTYGEYGKYGGTDFSLPVTEGKITGFQGKSGTLLDSFGVVLSP